MDASLSSCVDAPRAVVRRDLLRLGKYEKSVEEAKIAIEIDPDFSIGYAFSPPSIWRLGAPVKQRRPFSERPNANLISLISLSSDM